MELVIAHTWKRSPFIRVLLPFIAGIVLQWYGQFNASFLCLTGAVSCFILLNFFFLPFFQRYKLSFLNGLVTCLMFLSLGALLTYYKDIRHAKQWFGHIYESSSSLLVTLNEPPVEKSRSLKAEATVSYILKEKKAIPVKGKIIIYFKKDLVPPALAGQQTAKGDHTGSLPGYGSQLIMKKPIQEIRNAGNPGGFDYRRYALFHGITHQAYLSPGEFEILGSKNKKWIPALVHSARAKILTVLRKYIKNEKELGLAEALLIGYKDDLDKSLVQAYSNTGVVHIIAISGLHLGLIYWLLVKLFQPMKKRKKLKCLPPLLIIASLWAFSLLAGAQPSVLRSALMFSCIIAAETISRKTNIYNSLALSAFIILCINPYWLWDLGFQLSYAAVLSIVIFMRPIYNWFFFKNKLIDLIWKLNAVTLAAQVLTMPVSIYNFHQFPNYFLLTNLLAVPLSSVILLGEIFLCIIAFIPGVAILTGQSITWLIWLMNAYIEKIESLPFSLWNGIQINMAQVILLLIGISGASYWFGKRSITGLKAGLFALLGFTILRSYSFIESARQQQMIVYNVVQKKAIDFIHGNCYSFVGDSSLEENKIARNFHLQPSRILNRAFSPTESIHLNQAGSFISWHGKHILLIDEVTSFSSPSAGEQKQSIDLLVISKKPTIDLEQLSGSMNIQQVVFDGSVPAWKSMLLKKDCDRLHIPWHDVMTKGAFAMNLR